MGLGLEVETRGADLVEEADLGNEVRRGKEPVVEDLVSRWNVPVGLGLE